MNNTKRTYLIAAAVFLCLCPLVAAGIGYLYFSDMPPGSLSDSGYYVRRTKVYFHPGFGLASPFEITGADHDSFVILDQSYALDASHVYIDGSQIPDADPSTFELLQHPFARDSRHVYASGHAFSDDPANFESLAENISRDGKHIYWNAGIISDDPSHLVIIGSWNYHTYLKDSKTVFVNGNPIQGADANSFEVIADAYSRDERHVFYFYEIIPNADGATFEMLESPYARDGNAVYWMGQAIPNADPKTFKVLNANFECSADADHAYYQDQVIANVDPSALPSNIQVTGCSETEIYTNP
ncbi:DKNYY domain-containing protein [Candidatus Villigracilis affinis]|uniref:DKNYY domain-containing protein n=1 Tax=Candidatus Villigracilis affinis TaxID=3140682 RepID=UPI001D57C608|nr:DKNYY domain-containing protein [Anaerolineales bacterium]